MTEQRKSKVENFNRKMTELFSDDDRLDALLSLEKTNRRVDQKQLVFAGLSDVSAQTFCSVKAVLRARESEKMYFGAYLSDRLRYANELGLLESWPQSEAELLQAGHSITFDQVEDVERRHYGTHALPAERSGVFPLEIEIQGQSVDYSTRGDVFEFFLCGEIPPIQVEFPLWPICVSGHS